MFHRIGAMVRKEFIQLRRDRRSLAMMLMLPVIWLVAFGYAVNFDIHRIHVYVVDEANNADSRQVIGQIGQQDDFSYQGKVSSEQARAYLKDGRADVVMVFPKDYRVLPKSSAARMRVWVDGSRLFTAQSAVRRVNEFLFRVQKESLADLQAKIKRSMTAPGGGIDLNLAQIQDPRLASMFRHMPAEQRQQIQAALQEQIGRSLASVVQQRSETIGQLFPKTELLQPSVKVWYNPDLKSVYYMIPGLVGLVLIFVTTLMTALGVVREKERGTLEQLIVSPLRPWELMVGKLLPYMLIALVDFLLVMAVGVWVFDVPYRGELGTFLLVALLFLTGSLGMGLLISTVSQNQQQAMQLAVLTLVPQFILSGFVFPLEAMPWGIRWLAYLMPLTYFLPISRGAFLKGVSPLEATTGLWVLAGYAVLFILIATVRFRRSLA
ncbi:ABC transporter permease [Polycladomyces sp. WAk]|uniref:ABC transporter permease n=1 Tax=Polycladomyces zharkentensis TaxID=2807616 RepID=A0ABS2WFZ2_9BACL|nr:ABC transporter permease [Polycladomyces sp. WAk]MBN2908470.1 ABC transporter permease [Polycladomyces sp. WAk]